MARFLRLLMAVGLLCAVCSYIGGRWWDGLGQDGQVAFLHHFMWGEFSVGEPRELDRRAHPEEHRLQDFGQMQAEFATILVVVFAMFAALMLVAHAAIEAYSPRIDD